MPPLGSRDIWFGANGFLAYTTNKHIIVISWAFKAVTVGKAPPPFLTAHYTGVGWMFTMKGVRFKMYGKKIQFALLIIFILDVV